MDSIRRTILQGEILALLHDIGKLSWPFIECGISSDEAMQKKTGQAHTVTFLNEKTFSTQKVLWRALPEGWISDIPGTPIDVLGALTGMHHGNVTPYSASFAAMPKHQKIYPHVVPLIMFADTADSLFSKGAKSTAENVQKKESLHLASPLGGRETGLTRQSIGESAEALGLAITSWAEGIENWNDDTLVKKRRSLIDILREHGSHHLAETRLPDNDVTLFQHSFSVASIFKALLAGRLLEGRWDGLLMENKELAHSSQELSLLALQWNEEAFLARSRRSFEIMGRRESIRSFADKVKIFVEEELALGNEIYRDHKGICFMVPSLGEDRSAALGNVMERLLAHIEMQSNASPMNGTLPWKLMHKESGLVLTQLLDFWNSPFDDAENLIAFGPASPAWMAKWKGKDWQICPRCGLHPLKITEKRTGSDADTACSVCREFIDNAAKKNSKSAKVADQFWNGTKRLALIQAVFPQDIICSGSVFRGTLDVKAQKWDEKKKEVLRHWEACLKGDTAKAEEARTFFRKLCSMKMNEEDGWCSHVDTGSGAAVYVRACLEAMVPELRGGARLASAEQEAEAILWWALSQTPAPSRMARLWEKTREFMEFEPDVDCVPLTRDLSSFQLLVYAGDAMQILQDVTARYEAQFAHVRHLLPLHLSAIVFKSQSPLYLAMDAARRFRRISERGTELWTLKSCDDGSLIWLTGCGREVTWRGLGGDKFRGWFVAEDGKPVHVSALEAGRRYEVRPSTFDYEVLDSFARRYDIVYGEDWKRSHYMSRSARPRPYPIETIADWKNNWYGMFRASSSGEHQRKTAVELLARLHMDWPDCKAGVFQALASDIMSVTMSRDMTQKNAESICCAACDGTFFDIYEWYDFIEKRGEHP